MVDEKIADEIIDEFIEKELKKDLTQEDKVDESVEKHLQEMGFLWDRVQSKFLTDKTCFSCKKEVSIDGGDIRVVEASKVEKGVIAFVSICPACHKKNDDEQIVIDEQKEIGEKNE